MNALSIAEAVAGLPEPERTRRLDELCAGDPDKRAKVLRLMDASRPRDDGLEKPVLERVDLPEWEAPPTIEAEFGPTDTVGPYLIEKVLGHGGSGTVYRVRRGSPDTMDDPSAPRYALKIIDPAYILAGGQKRFQLEIHALALLNHPAIARSIESQVIEVDGVSRSTLCTEFIDGDPLMKHIEKHKLEENERLDLFVRICDAVHHAHLKSVVHRDLKPANILVTPAGQPKILDFGIAKITGGDLQVTVQATANEAFVGTPDFMSPEQIRSDTDAVDHRSDIYTLGVLLHAMLAGELPYELRGKSIVQKARVVQEESPRFDTKASEKLSPGIRAIIRKAMDKSPKRRHATADELSQDVRRLLAGSPRKQERLEAVRYEVREFTRRHRVLSAAVCAAFVTLLVGIASTTAFAVQAFRAAGAAELARQSEAYAVDALEDNFSVADRYALLGAEFKPETVLSTSINLPDALSNSAKARIWYRTGRTYDNMNKHDLGARLLGQSAELQRTELKRPMSKDQRQNAEVRLANTLDFLAWARFHTGDIPGGLGIMTDCWKLRSRVLGPAHDDTIASHGDMARMLMDDGQSKLGFETYLDMLAIAGKYDRAGMFEQLKGLATKIGISLMTGNQAAAEKDLRAFLEPMLANPDLPRLRYRLPYSLAQVGQRMLTLKELEGVPAPVRQVLARFIASFAVKLSEEILPAGHPDRENCRTVLEQIEAAKDAPAK